MSSTITIPEVPIKTHEEVVRKYIGRRDLNEEEFKEYGKALQDIFDILIDEAERQLEAPPSFAVEEPPAPVQEPFIASSGDGYYLEEVTTMKFESSWAKPYYPIEDYPSYWTVGKPVFNWQKVKRLTSPETHPQFYREVTRVVRKKV